MKKVFFLPDVLLGQRAQRNPVAIALTLGSECRSHAHPVLGLLLVAVLAVGIDAPDNVAESVAAVEVPLSGVVTALLRRTVDDLFIVLICQKVTARGLSRCAPWRC